MKRPTLILTALLTLLMADDCKSDPNSGQIGQRCFGNDTCVDDAVGVAWDWKPSEDAKKEHACYCADPSTLVVNTRPKPASALRPDGGVRWR